MAEPKLYYFGWDRDSGHTLLGPRLEWLPRHLRLAAPDLAQLREKMSAAIERAKADDPKALRARIKTLEGELAAAQKVKAAPAPKPVETRVEVPMFDAELFDELGRELSAHYQLMVNNFRAELHRYKSKLLENSGAKPGALIGRPKPLPEAIQPRPAETLRERTARIRDRDVKPENGEVKLGKCERALLSVLMQRHGQCTTASQLAILSGYSHRSSGFQHGLGALRSRGLASGGGDDIRITDAGETAVPDVHPLPTGDALVQYWQGRLGKCERTLLGVLREVYPSTLTKEVLAERAGYSVASSGFQHGLGKLRSLELARGGGEAIQMSGSLA